MNSGKPDFFTRLGAINVYRRGEQRASHKPLFLLLLLSRLQQGLPRLVGFVDVRAKLGEALQLYAPRVAGVNPHYPFWRLQNDDLSEVIYHGELRIRQSNNDPTVSSLIASEAKGGLLEADFDLLKGDLDLQSLAVRKILDAHFPQVIHGDVVNFFGLRLNTPHRDDHSSYGDFFSAVIDAYMGRCAVSNLSLAYRGRSVGLDATHICWPQIGGNDAISNGIAMTSLHARLFHLGIFTITPGHEIQVCGGGRFSDECESIGLKNGRKMNLPTDESKHPSIEALRWHNKSVFRG